MLLNFGGYNLLLLTIDGTSSGMLIFFFIRRYTCLMFEAANISKLVNHTAGGNRAVIHVTGDVERNVGIN